MSYNGDDNLQVRPWPAWKCVDASVSTHIQAHQIRCPITATTTCRYVPCRAVPSCLPHYRSIPLPHYRTTALPHYRTTAPPNYLAAWHPPALDLSCAPTSPPGPIPHLTPPITGKRRLHPGGGVGKRRFHVFFIRLGKRPIRDDEFIRQDQRGESQAARAVPPGAPLARLEMLYLALQALKSRHTNPSNFCTCRCAFGPPGHAVYRSLPCIPLSTWMHCPYPHPPHRSPMARAAVASHPYVIPPHTHPAHPTHTPTHPTHISPPPPLPFPPPPRCCRWTA